MSEAVTTTNHEAIRRWAESRKGRPAVVRSTAGKDGGGLLRIDFDPPDEALEHVSWEEFFATFDANELAFLYQEETADGSPSRFNKFVDRKNVDTKRSKH